MIGIGLNPTLFPSGAINPLSILPGQMRMWINSTSKSVTAGTIDAAITGVTDLSPYGLSMTSTSPNRAVWSLGAPDSSASRNTFKNGSLPAIYIEFSGADQINVTTPPTLVSGMSIFATVSFTGSTTGGSVGSYGNLNLVGGLSSFLFLGFNYTNAGDAFFSSYNYGTSAYDVITSAALNLNDGKAHTICGTINFITYNVTLYVDGKYIGAVNQSGNSPEFGSWSFSYIGQAFSGGGNGFNAGMIAEMFEWDGELSSQQVSLLHARSKILWSP